MAVKMSKIMIYQVTPFLHDHIHVYIHVHNIKQIDLHVLEEKAPGEGVIIPKGDLIPFWPLTDSNRLLLRIENENSVLFNYKTSDSIVLKLKTEVYMNN